MRIRAGDLPPKPFSARDIYRKQWHGLADSTAVKKGCRLLFEFGWLIEVNAGSSSGGRPADPLYLMSPAIDRMQESEEETPKFGTDKTAKSTSVSFGSSEQGEKSSHFHEAADCPPPDEDAPDYVEVTL